MNIDELEGWKLNSLIAEKIMGLNLGFISTPNYSIDIQAAFEVVEAMRKKKYFLILRDDFYFLDACFYKNNRVLGVTKAEALEALEVVKDA